MPIHHLRTSQTTTQSTVTRARIASHRHRSIAQSPRRLGSSSRISVSSPRSRVPASRRKSPNPLSPRSRKTKPSRAVVGPSLRSKASNKYASSSLPATRKKTKSSGSTGSSSKTSKQNQSPTSPPTSPPTRRVPDHKVKELQSALASVTDQYETASKQLQAAQIRVTELSSQLRERKTKRQDATLNAESLRARVEQQKHEIQALREAADKRTRALKADVEKKKRQLAACTRSYGRLREEHAEVQKRASKLLFQIKRLRLRASGRESHRRGKMALAQFEKMDRKIKDLEFHVFYGDAKSEVRVGELEARLRQMEGVEAAQAEALRQVQKLQAALDSAAAARANEWLFGGDRELFLE